MALDTSIPVLVVDDYKTMIRIIRNLLKQLGFEDVDEATDGTEALGKLKERRYGLVISDWNMEPMTGYELLKQVRGDTSLARTPFIMVTAESKTENVIAAKKAGVNNYIVKPFNAADAEGQDRRRCSASDVTRREGQAGMGQLHADHIERVIDWVRQERRGESISLEALMRLSEVMAEGFRSAVEPLDIAVSRRARRHGARDRRHEARHRRARTRRYAARPHSRGGRELDAIVEATEDATNTIMSAAEAIMAADASDPERLSGRGERQDRRDLRGLLVPGHHRPADLQGGGDAEPPRHADLDAGRTAEADRRHEPAVRTADLGETEQDRRRRELILHGPQLKGAGVNQDDVDALCADPHQASRGRAARIDTPSIAARLATSVGSGSSGRPEIGGVDAGRDHQHVEPLSPGALDVGRKGVADREHPPARQRAAGEFRRAFPCATS